MLGDTALPVPAGAPFARLRSGGREEIERLKPRGDANWTLSDDGKTLVASILGLVEDSDEGLRVRPLWSLSKDKTRLLADLSARDFQSRPLSVGQIKEQVEAGTKLSVDLEMLASCMARSEKGGQLQPGCELARGTPPVPGENGRVELFFDQDKTAGTARENGSIDFRERGGTSTVPAGAVLARLHPPTKGAEGKDLFGETVPATDGKPLTIKAGEKVKEHPGADGIIEFHATAEGIPRLEQGVLRVSELLQIPGDVDMSSGNIRSPLGSVHVGGSVRDGFEVSAAKDITVVGSVENADIDSGGDVVVGGGILLGKGGKIRAGGNLAAKFIHNAQVRAGGDVTTQKDIVQCEITAIGRVTTRAVRGGRVRCGSGLEATELGSEGGAATVIEVCIEGPELMNILARKEELDASYEKLTRGIGTEDMLAALKAPEEDRRILAELMKIRSTVQTEIKSLVKEIGRLRGETDRTLAGATVKATGKVHPGTEVRIGGRTYEVSAPMPATEFAWNPGKAEIETR